jgi:acyl-CoA thioesterase I
MLCGCSKPRSVQRNAPAVPGGEVMNDPIPASTADTVGLKTYLALGDSYTFGQSVQENRRLPVQVSEQLSALWVKVAAPEIIAQSGWTTGDLLNRLRNAPPRFSNYNIVTLLIGVNNQYQGASQEQYRSEFTDLVTKAIGYAGNISNRVFVLSIPDWSVMPFAANRNRNLISKQVDSFNVINKEISFQKKVHYTDVTELSRLAVSDASLIADDGLHPSAEQYRLWANRLVPTIRVIFY